MLVGPLLETPTKAASWRAWVAARSIAAPRRGVAVTTGAASAGATGRASARNSIDGAKPRAWTAARLCGSTVRVLTRAVVRPGPRPDASAASRTAAALA